jgi:hypothetical protein
MDPAQLDPNGDGSGRVVGSNSRRVDDTRVKPSPSQSGVQSGQFRNWGVKITA